jgi:hypothetical protein
VPGVRAQQGYSWWMDGILQNSGHGTAPRRLPGANTDSISRPDGLAFRSAWSAVLRAGKRPLRTVRAHVGPDGRPDAMPPTVGDRLHLYLYRLGTAGAVTPEPAAPEPVARRDGGRAGRGDDGGGGEGAPTGAGAGRSRCPDADQSGLPGGGPAAACPGRWRDLIVSVAAAAVIVVARWRRAGVWVRRLHRCDPGRARHLPIGRLWMLPG